MLGLSFNDFRLLTPAELDKTAEAWAQRHEDDQRAQWERTRMAAAILIQPHVTKAVTPERLLPLPWDTPAKTETERSTRARFEAAVAAMTGG